MTEIDEAVVRAAAERIVKSGILDEITDAGAFGALGERDELNDAATIARIVLETARDA